MHSLPRAVCVAVILTDAASYERRCLQLASAESVADARSVEATQLTSDIGFDIGFHRILTIGLHHILTIADPISCAEQRLHTR